MLTGAEVCAKLGVSSAWLARHRSLFEWFRIPGRGATGQEYRFTRISVENYVQQGLVHAASEEDPFAGKTVAEITALVRSGVGIFS